MRILGVIALVVLSASCTSIEDEPITDDEGNVIPVPGPYDMWLEVEEVSPPGGDVSLRPEIRVRFNAHLEDDLFVDFAVGWLSSGGIRAPARVRYDVQERTLVLRPYRDLIDGLKYRLFLNDVLLKSVTGAPPKLGALPLYTASSEVEIEPDTQRSAVWPEVAEVFEDKCWSCHRDPQWQLNPLSPESMVGVAADGADEYLITRYDPADSYLMHKIIHDYPLRRLGVEPPEWADLESLTDDEVSMIQAWIRAGAP